MRYWLVFGLALGIATLEFYGSSISGSWALSADAIHVVLDGLAVLVTICVARITQKNYTAGILAERKGVQVNLVLLIVAIGVIVFEAWQRIGAEQEVAGVPMLVVGIIGGIGNYFQHRVLCHGHKHNGVHKLLHVHVKSDLAQSILGVLMPALVIAGTGWGILDPLASFGIATWMGWQAVKIAQQHYSAWR